MPSTKNVNYMTVVHKKSTGIAACFPDVCKTPTPGGPVPIPYPNIAMSAQAAKTSKKVKVDGEGVMVKGSNFSMSSGDEAGNAGGGVVSNKFKGKAEYLNYSFDVKFEGKNVCRLADPMGNNCGSTFNGPCPGEAQAPTVVMPGKEAGDLEACERLEKKRVPEKDRDQVARDHGMLPEHAKAFREEGQSTGMSATVRQGNSDCLGKIADGFPTKPGGGAGDTISDTMNLPDECQGLVGNPIKEGGNVVGFDGINGTNGPISTDALISKRQEPGMTSERYTAWLKDQGAWTGDYDLHDVFDGAGSRVRDGSGGETGFINGVNDAIGQSDVDTRMVQHGPQANIAEHFENNPEKADKLREAFGDEKFERIQKPDVCRDPPKPLLHFDKNGEMYLIETEQDLKDLYACKGEEQPSHWNKPKK